MKIIKKKKILKKLYKANSVVENIVRDLRLKKKKTYSLLNILFLIKRQSVSFFLFKKKNPKFSII